jgi:transmembrane sensor
LAREQLGTLSAADHERLEAWLSVSENAVAYEHARSAMAAVGQLAASAALEKMRAAALAARPDPVRSPGRRLAAAAAALALVLVGFVVGASWKTDTLRVATGSGSSEVFSPAPSTVREGPERRGTTAPPAPRRIATAVGESRSVALDDGTIVTADTNTVLEFAYTTHRREVRLLSGQAFFDVAKDESRPFAVTGAGHRVTAVGTRFNVRVVDRRLRVALVEGRVIVDPVQPMGAARFLPVLARTSLTPGDELFATPGAEPVVLAADLDQVTSWRRDQIIVRDQTVADAVAELNRYSQFQIVVEDPRVAGLRISGVFGTRRPGNFAAAIAAAYPVDAVAVSDQVTVLRWREPDTPSPAR